MVETTIVSVAWKDLEEKKNKQFCSAYMCLL